MTQKEWTELCRETKNKGEYIYLIKSIRHYIKRNKDTDGIFNYSRFFSYFLKNLIKRWYKNYYKEYVIKRK